MADYSVSETITTAGTVTTPVQRFDPGAVADIALQSDFTYGSGGTSVDVYLQTSVDDGDNWVDIANHHFTTSSARKVSAVKRYSARAEAAATDGSLADDTELDGFIGNRIRLKIVSAGTYAGGTTIAVSAALG